MTLDIQITLALLQKLLLILRAKNAEVFTGWLDIDLKEMERKTITMGNGKVEIQTKVV
jgi:hypothetical protein